MSNRTKTTRHQRVESMSDLELLAAFKVAGQFNRLPNGPRREREWKAWKPLSEEVFARSQRYKARPANWPEENAQEVEKKG